MSAGFVAVVGTINRDDIVTPDRRAISSLGGILYSAIPLAALLEGSGLAVRLFGRLGAEDLEEATRILEPFPAASPDGLIVDEGGTNRSLLDYSGPGERVESVEMNVSELSPEDLADVAGAKAALVNMISGRDLTVETAAGLASASSARFFLDVQALARTLETPRRPRDVPDWRAWCETFHVIRGNEVEIAHFAGCPGDVREAMRRILEAGAEGVLATRGEQGSLLATRAQGTIAEIPVYERPAVGELTGCGDSYLAGVCAGHVLGLSPESAAHLGAWTASQIAALEGIESMRALVGLRRRAAALFLGL